MIANKVHAVGYYPTARTMGRPGLANVDDWFFGSRTRRRLLEVLTDDKRLGPWTQIELARAVGAADKGTVEAPLRRLADVGLARRRDDGRWERGRNDSLVGATRALLNELAKAVDDG